MGVQKREAAGQVSETNMVKQLLFWGKMDKTEKVRYESLNAIKLWKVQACWGF
jgi:hypothetical protein